MSDMHFREPNQVKWMGSRPGHNGTQVIVMIDTAVSGELYEVTAGKTFYLTAFSVGQNMGVNQNCFLSVRNILDAGVYHLAHISVALGNMGGNCALSFYYPLEIPSLFDFYINCANLARGFIAGWEE